MQASLCAIQERLIVGRTSETQTNMVPEGEILLTINVYYPAVYEKVSFYISFK